MNHWKKLLVSVLVVGAGLGASGCRPCPRGSYCVNGVTRPLPARIAAPAFVGVPWARPWAEVEAYVNTLDFDSSHTAGHGSFLPLGGPAGPLSTGPYVTFYPEKGAGQVDTAAMHRGRIVARIEASAAYPPLGLNAGVSYVWIDTVGGGRMVFIPVNLTPPITVRTA